jgi:hypothetical protein
VELGSIPLGRWSPIPCTYAGGIRNAADVELVGRLGSGKVHYTIGSALDIFGGPFAYADVVAFDKKQAVQDLERAAAAAFAAAASAPGSGSRGVWGGGSAAAPSSSPSVPVWPSKTVLVAGAVAVASVVVALAVVRSSRRTEIQ